LKILQLIDSLSAGGAERMAVNISNALVDDSHEVWLCASRTGGQLVSFIDHRVNYNSLEKKNGLDIRAFYKLVQLIRKNNITMIHAHSSSLFWAVAAKIFKPSLKVIWHDHLGKRLEEDKLNRFIIIISVGIDAVIAVNDTLKQWSQKQLMVPASKIVFINNFPLLRSIQSGDNNPNPKVQIVCLANLRWQKDHITLIKAIDVLVNSENIKNINIILAGHYSEDECYQQIISEIELRKLKPYFQIKGSVHDTAALLYNANIGVLSSVSEGLPVSLLEYGLAGLPVVITNAGQCAEVIENGRFGKLVPSKNPEEFALALKELILNESDSRSMGLAFKAHVEKTYGAQQFLLNYYKLIQYV
jgi:glycosyltransferase involved in cell wall biosynthesis